MDVTIGIDPGKAGAIALIRVDGSTIIYDTPVIYDGKKNQYDLNAINEIVHQFKVEGGAWPRAIIEQVNAMPGQGVTSMFSMGYGLGMWHTVLTCHGISFVRVRPQEWKKEFGLLKTEKGASILRAKELFPSADIRLKKHDGRAEALLMAHYLHIRNPKE